MTHFDAIIIILAALTAGLFALLVVIDNQDAHPDDDTDKN